MCMCAGFAAHAAAAAESSEDKALPIPAPEAIRGEDPKPPQAKASQDLEASQTKKDNQLLVRKEAEKSGLPPDIADAV